MNSTYDISYSVAQEVFQKSLTPSIAVSCAEPESALQKFWVLFIDTK